MTTFKEGMLLEETKDHLVVGHYHGKAIISDEEDELFFVECTEESAPVGTCPPDTVLVPISELNKEEQEEIMDFYG